MQSKTRYLIEAIIFGIMVSIVTVVLVRNCLYFIRWWTQVWTLADFSHYYATAWIAYDWNSPYGIDFGTTRLSEVFSWHPYLRLATNPPLLVLLTRPLARFDPKTAWFIWLVFLTLPRIANPFLIIRALGKNWTRKQCFLVLFAYFASWPLWSEIKISQVQSLILFFIILGWILIRCGREFVGGMLWGAATALKLYTWPFLLYLVLSRRSKAAIGSLLSCGFLIVVPCALWGTNIYFDWVRFGLPWIGEWATRSADNLSFPRAILNLIDHFLAGSSGKVNGTYLTMISALVAFFSCFALGSRRMGKREFDFAVVVLVLVSFLAGPLSWDHYWVSYLLVYSILVNYLCTNVWRAVGFFLIWVGGFTWSPIVESGIPKVVLNCASLTLLLLSLLLALRMVNGREMQTCENGS